MFAIHIITDVIKIPASDLHYRNTTSSTEVSEITPVINTTYHVFSRDTAARRKVKTKKSLLPIIHREIDILYPNRVLVDVGLVISRYFHPMGSAKISSRTHPLPIEANHQPDDPTSKKRKRSPSSTSVATKRKTKEELLFTGTTLLQNGGTCDNYGSSMNGGCGVHYKVQFPVIVFRPYVGEVLYGTICDMNQHGIVVTLGNFFAAIYIPTIYMLHPSTYENASVGEGHTTSNNSSKGIWIWSPTYDDDEEENGDEENNNNEPLRYEMNIGDEIRVRVKSIHYTKPESTTSMLCKNGKPSQVDPVHQHPKSNSVNTTAATTFDSQPQQPLQHCAMYIIASICEDGLGLTSWWKNEMDEADDEEE